MENWINGKYYKESIDSVAFSQDGKLIAWPEYNETSDSDHEINLLNISSGKTEKI